MQIEEKPLQMERLFVFMLKLKVRFGEPEHGWIEFSVLDSVVEVVKYDVSDIYPSFDLLVAALLSMLDAGEEQLVEWALEPAELELRFSRQSKGDVIRLEIRLFEIYQPSRPQSEPKFTFTGNYDEICLPFWSALQELQGRYSARILESEWHWTGNFPHHELALLTERLGKQ